MKKLRTLFLAGLLAITSVTNAQNLFSGGHEDFEVSFNAGWAAKQWVTHRNGRTLREDLWGNNNRMLHGLQLGFGLYSCNDLGLGFKTGLDYEWYSSQDDFLKQCGWDRFNEYCLYLPLHAMWRIPLGRRVSITPFGGIGLNWSMWGKVKNGAITDAMGYDSDGRWHFTESSYFDYNNETPHHWNVQLEYGAMLRIQGFLLTFTYSNGLNRHQLYKDAPSYQNKFSLSIAYAVGDD